MKKLLLDRVYDIAVPDKLKADNRIFQKIVAKYKKSDSFEDEKEITNDLCELICKVQKIAFKAGVTAAVDIMSKKGDCSDA